MKPCHCKAYPFPHRPNSGQCEGDETTAVEDSSTALDEYLDDPRRGQAEWINERIER
jgi:hypothetical protein